MHRIKVQNYSKNIKQAKILENISIEFESGKTYGLVGRNGSGKTMLLRALARLIMPSSGTIQFNGIDLSNPDAIKLRPGIVLEHAEMYPYLTGYDNLKFLASINNLITSKEIINAMIRVGLDPNDVRIYKKYSLGMKQRLAIAQAIMEKPDYLLFDEPTNALDSEGLELWRAIISDESERGAIIVLCSHSKQEIQTLCHVVYTISEGRIINHE